MELPRSNARDFEALADHYGFSDYGTASLKGLPDVRVKNALDHFQNQEVQVLKAILNQYGATREEWYGLNDARGLPMVGSFRNKSMALCATIPLGIYRVIEREGDRLLLAQSNEVRGVRVWGDDWRTMMSALPVNIVLEANGLGKETIAVDDRISFVGIQTSVAAGEVFTPIVRVLGIRNETTRDFFNFENPESPLGELPELKEAKKAREAAEAQRKAEEAKAKEIAEKAEAERKAEEDRKERENKEWLDSLKKKGRPDTGSGGDPFAFAGSSTKGGANLPADIASAQTELEKLNATIASEQARWREALATINRLTVNKTKPVVEGSPQYHQCMAASQIIHEVEQGAQALKDRKAALEARVKELEK